MRMLFGVPSLKRGLVRFLLLSGWCLKYLFCCVVMCSNEKVEAIGRKILEERTKQSRYTVLPGFHHRKVKIVQPESNTQDLPRPDVPAGKSVTA